MNDSPSVMVKKSTSGALSLVQNQYKLEEKIADRAILGYHGVKGWRLAYNFTNMSSILPSNRAVKQS